MLNYQRVYIDLLVLNVGHEGMIHNNLTITTNNNPTFPQQPIHSLRLAPGSWERPEPIGGIPFLTEQARFGIGDVYFCAISWGKLDTGLRFVSENSGLSQTNPPVSGHFHRQTPRFLPSACTVLLSFLGDRRCKAIWKPNAVVELAEGTIMEVPIMCQ